ncbi:MAG TPA: ABC transporter permease [Bacteroidota bacterium]|nr:ABC transporter permease [Bacteroidota bacterium]
MSWFTHEWSQIRESTAMALAAVRSSKLRSILTLLGIAVGVFSIIAVMTAVSVLRNAIEEGISQLGANTFQMQKFPVVMGDERAMRRKYRNRKNISYEQASAVKEKITHAEMVGIEGWRFGKTVVWNGQKTNPNIQVAGEDVEGIPTNDWSVMNGRAIGQQDLQNAAKVVVLGSTLTEKLFPENIDPVGQSIRLDGAIYQIIGVFQKKGGALGGNQDNFLVMPITTFFNAYGKESTDIHIMVKAKSREVLDDCIEEARLILRTARKVAPGDDDDFGYFSNDSLVTQFNEFTLYLRLGVLLVSSIALLAAGVGIMNIMLVSVTERTREIGIRKSVGAMKRDILAQFIIEAVILCEIGGIVGIVLGILGGNVVGLLVSAPAVIPWDWAAIGVGVTSLVGLIFGVYPAWKAAALDPIESLRYE